MLGLQAGQEGGYQWVTEVDAGARVGVADGVRGVVEEQDLLDGWQLKSPPLRHLEVVQTQPAVLSLGPGVLRSGGEWSGPDPGCAQILCRPLFGADFRIIVKKTAKAAAGRRCVRRLGRVKLPRTVLVRGP